MLKWHVFQNIISLQTIIVYKIQSASRPGFEQFERSTKVCGKQRFKLILVSQRWSISFDGRHFAMQYFSDLVNCIFPDRLSAFLTIWHQYFRYFCKKARFQRENLKLYFPNGDQSSLMADTLSWGAPCNINLDEGPMMPLLFSNTLTVFI